MADKKICLVLSAVLLIIPVLIYKTDNTNFLKYRASANSINLKTIIIDAGHGEIS